MFNDDLIAYLRPEPNRFNPHEWRDVTGSFGDIRVEPHRFTLRGTFAPGIYRARIETASGAFDMQTAMIPMVRVPDGQRVPVGPWDLNHIDNYMAMPMARTYVNGKLKGGMWFDMPGPQQIRESRLAADFGFETEEGETELVLEFVERDRQRLDWSRVAIIEIRKDNRSLCPLLPASELHPRIYVNAVDLPEVRKRWSASPLIQQLVEGFRVGKFGPVPDTVGDLDLALLTYVLTDDRQIGDRVKEHIIELCQLPTWSGRPDPLLMGGDNDRIIGVRLYCVGLAWDYLQPLFNASERATILEKAGEYLQKIYDFTVLQRAYMGQPTSEPHSLGTWNGVGIACMAFYDDLPIARKALPFFHGLFRDSLSLFPPSGKVAWATYFPFHLIRYLAAAHTFGGQRPELSQSLFLDNLGDTLAACFRSPNTQELQRGLRTTEHRYLCSFLHRFHHRKGIDAIYQAFVDQEKKTAGNVLLTIFDILFSPTTPSSAAPLPAKPLYAKDIGDIICTSRSDKMIGVSLSAGLKGGARSSFTLASHNREYPVSMASIEVSVDGAPVLNNIDIGTYGINSALTNTMCFDNGGVLTQGQYLNGNIGPDKSAYLRRVLVGDRFIYTHSVITAALDPELHVHRAERIMIFDLRTGSILLADSFEGAKPIRFATHLHCSGSIKEMAKQSYRLTGGQANLIAGIKGGSKGFSDEEHGEVFVSILNSMDHRRVVTEEPAWFPGYIYGLNGTGREKLEDGRYPRYSRWRLEALEPSTKGSFLFALATSAASVKLDGNRVSFPDGAQVILSELKPTHALDCECVAESVLVDSRSRSLVLIGARRFASGDSSMSFSVPTDIEIAFGGNQFSGRIYSTSSDCVGEARNVGPLRWRHEPQNRQSSCQWTAELSSQ